MTQVTSLGHMIGWGKVSQRFHPTPRSVGTVVTFWKYLHEVLSNSENNSILMKTCKCNFYQQKCNKISLQNLDRETQISRTEIFLKYSYTVTTNWRLPYEMLSFLNHLSLDQFSFIHDSYPIRLFWHIYRQAAVMCNSSLFTAVFGD